jgi:hypothetical protein
MLSLPYGRKGRTPGIHPGVLDLVCLLQRAADLHLRL